MPEGVAGDGLRDPGPLARIFDGPLDDGVVEVVPEETTGGRFPKLAVCGKYPLPPTLAVRGLVLPIERIRKCNVTAPSFQISFMLLLYLRKVMIQAGFRGRRKNGYPVPVSLPFPYDDLPIAEVDVLYPETEAFEQPQAGVVHQHRRDPFHAVQVQ